MNAQKTILSSSIALALGMASHSAQAGLTTSATLDFTLGTSQVIACTNGTSPPCVMNSYNIVDIVGSYFVIDSNKDGIADSYEKTPIGSFNGIHIGTTQLAGNPHGGSINGSELPDIDAPWEFRGNTGMNQTTAPTTVASTGTDGNGNMTAALNLAWSIAWNSITNVTLAPTSPVQLTCDTSDCSASSSYTLDATYHIVGFGFTSVSYFLHLEGSITTSAVPVPAAAWLFGSGLAGLMSIARRKKKLA